MYKFYIANVVKIVDNLFQINSDAEIFIIEAENVKSKEDWLSHIQTQKNKQHVETLKNELGEVTEIIHARVRPMLEQRQSMIDIGHHIVYGLYNIA